MMDETLMELRRLLKGTSITPNNVYSSPNCETIIIGVQLQYLLPEDIIYMVQKTTTEDDAIRRLRKRRLEQDI